MTVKEFYNKIETYKENEMNFKIEEVFSWRGIYSEPCVSLSTNKSTKEENLNMLNRLCTETFEGWKGGEYEYSWCDTIHFEAGEGSYSEGDYILKFIIRNTNDEIKHIFD